jgi:hypothetical protein
MPSRTLPDPATLRRLYAEEGHTIRSLARLFHCRPHTLIAALDAADIVRRRRGPRRAALPDWDQEKLQQLAKLQGMPYVRRFARRHGVNTTRLAVLLGRSTIGRGRADQHRVIDHDGAIRDAYDRGAAVKDLAAHYGCSLRAIGYSLDRTSGNQSAANADRTALVADWFPSEE